MNGRPRLEDFNGDGRAYNHALKVYNYKRLGAKYCMCMSPIMSNRISSLFLDGVSGTVRLCDRCGNPILDTLQ